MIELHFTAPLWLWKGDSAWHFVTVPQDASDTLRSFAPDAKRGFGSVRVGVSIGETRWQTSVFPDKKSGCYLLPVKKAVRTAEGLSAGSEAEVTLELSI